MSDFLEVDGWQVEQIFEEGLEWWADEIWEIKSTWSPHGSSAYLTFLVDPQHEGNRKKGQSVWGIGASKVFPRSREEAEGVGIVTLNSKFKENIMEFSLELETLRTND